MGGLSRKAFLIKNITEQERLPSLFLDSGALLFKQKSLQPEQRRQSTATARGIARAMEAMDCRAMGIAAQDLAGGIDLLKELQDSEQLTWLSMNLVANKTRRPIFAPLVNTEVGGTRIAILGLTDEQAGSPDNGQYTILPWQQVLPEVLAGIDKSTEMVILLSSYPQLINQEIARTVQGIDLILQSGHSAANKPPQKTGNSLLAQVADQGKYIGMMRINWTEAGQWGVNFAKQIRAEQNRLDRINWQIVRMEKRGQDKNPGKKERYSQLLADRQQSEQKIVELKKDRQGAIAEPCSFRNRFIALKSSLPEDRQVQAIIDQTTREVN